MGARIVSDTDGPAGSMLPTWREETLRSMLGVAAVVAPVAGVVAVLGRPPPRPLLDTVVILGVGAATPLLRWLPRLSYTKRTLLVMLLLWDAGLFVVFRSGLSPGAALLFAVSSIFAAIYFGRAAAYGTVAIGAISFVVVGWLVTSGRAPMPHDIFAVQRFGNWLRVGAIFALIGTLLASGVAFVIGRVEAGARDL